VIVEIPGNFKLFPKIRDISYLLFNYIVNNGGRITEYELYSFYKLYPEFYDKLNSRPLGEFCSSEHCEGLILLGQTADLTDKSKILSTLSSASTFVSASQSTIIQQILQKLKDYRKIDAFSSFDWKLKYLLQVCTTMIANIEHY